MTDEDDIRRNVRPWLLAAASVLIVVGVWTNWSAIVGLLPWSKKDRSAIDVRQAWKHEGDYAISSSPRVMDVNGDGVGDVLLGHGSEMGRGPSHVSWGYVVAIDGRTGAELWRVEAQEAIVGTATLVDLTSDGQQDLVIGGRDAELIAIEPREGRVLWRFDRTAYPNYRFNFYSAAVGSDQDGDGIADLVVANGGDSALPKSAPRKPGFVLLLSGSDGKVISALETPDSAEMFMSPVVYSAGGDQFVLFGTGGETLPGSLWRISLDDLRERNASGAQELISSETKGFIAPPSVADLNSDGTPDIVAQAFDGRLVALDGRTFATLWSREFANAESYNSPAIGLFDDDEVPDVFAGVVYGEFPRYTEAEYVIVDGGGEDLWRAKLGWRSASGPLAVDLDKDGRDEGLLGMVDFPLARNGVPQYRIYTIDLPAGIVRPLGSPLGLDSIAAPWTGDIDADGFLDVVASTSTGYEGRGTRGATVLLRTEAPSPAEVSWGEYLGTHGDAVYRD